MSIKRKQSFYYEDWIVKARRDSDTAYLNHRHKGYTDTTCYFCHQTAEKALKAFLLFSGIKRLPYIHTLLVLLVACKKKDLNFQELVSQCEQLDEYFIETKYPLSAPIDYPRDEAETAIRYAEEILNFVEEKISESKISEPKRT